MTTQYLGFEPRTSVCNWCLAVKPFDTVDTHIHHDEDRYDDNNILRYTIELCESCYRFWRYRVMVAGQDFITKEVGAITNRQTWFYVDVVIESRKTKN